MGSSILQTGEPSKATDKTVRACTEIAQMLSSYTDISGTSEEAKTAAKNMAENLKSSTGSARPILEISHDLWIQYRKREGQPLDAFLSQENASKWTNPVHWTSYHV